MVAFKLSKRWRMAKTVILAVAACAALVWGAIYSWGVEPEELMQMFLLCLLLLAVAVALALVAAAVIVLIRKLKR